MIFLILVKVMLLLVYQNNKIKGTICNIPKDCGCCQNCLNELFLRAWSELLLAQFGHSLYISQIVQGSVKQYVWIILKVSKIRISTSTFLKGATPLYYHLLRGQTPPPTSQIWTAIKITTFLLVALVLAIGRVAIMVMVNGSVSFNCITFNLTDYSNHVMSTLAIFMLLLDIAIGVLIYYTQWKDTPLERFTSFMHSIQIEYLS